MLHRLLWLLLAPRVSGRPGWLVGAARIAAGVVFVSFSFGKFIRHEAEAASFDRYGIPLPDLTTYLIGSLELVGGLMLVLGLAVPLAALALAGDMVGVIASAGRVEGGPVNLGLAPVLLATMLVLIWAGAGVWSLDGRLLTRRSPRSSHAAKGPTPPAAGPLAPYPSRAARFGRAGRCPARVGGDVAA